MFRVLPVILNLKKEGMEQKFNNIIKHLFGR
jgi:hypothetical protein